MKLPVLNSTGTIVDNIEVSPQLFDAPMNKSLVHQVMVAYLANARQGTVAVKNRSRVSGGGAKPFAQKGTGNARQGSSKPPHYRGGATSMGPQNRDHSFSLNKKEKILALKCALSNKMKKNEIILVDSLEIKSHKTKDLFKSLQNFSFNSALFIHGDEEKTINFKRASSNIPKLATLLDKGINVQDLVLFEKIFIEKNSVQKISKRLL